MAAAAVLMAAAPALAGDGPLVRVHREGSGPPRVERILLERYVARVVAAELPSNWPAAALRAQAIASRTYVLHRMARARENGSAWDVEATTTGQVLHAGAAPATALAAARATAGQVLLYEGRPLLAAFHSASGGRTASAEEVWGEPHPYLISLPVRDEDDAPSTYWRARISRSTMRRALAAYGLDVGPIRDVQVVERSPSGRVLRVRIVGDRAEGVLLSGRELRDALGATRIKSTLFEIREVPAANRPGAANGEALASVGAGPEGASGTEQGGRNGQAAAPPRRRAEGGDFVVAGTGYGHGVGLSQWAARAMAERGAAPEEILSSFYRGAQLVRLDPAELVALVERPAVSARAGDLR